MAFDEKICEKILAPKMRLFLSVDLINSTKLKYGKNSILPLVESTNDEALLPKWHSHLFSFFDFFHRDFEHSVASYERALEMNSELTNKSKRDESKFNYYLWKKIGDQIVYVVEVKNSWQVYHACLIFINAIRKYRFEAANFVKDSKELIDIHVEYTAAIQSSGRYITAGATPLKDRDITAGIWLAGFPIINTEIPIAKPVDENDNNNYERDTIQNLHDLHILYENAAKVGKDLNEINRNIDFIGPSMDTGFRLCSTENKNEIPISIETAYVLSKVLIAIKKRKSNKKITAELEKIQNIELKFSKTYKYYSKFDPSKELFLRGYRDLKGVFMGDGYPIFWLKCPSPEVNQKYNCILQSVDSEKLVAFCNDLFKKYRNYLFKPFIKGCSLLSEKPKGYDDRREAWKIMLRNEMNVNSFGKKK